ncbi:hypothetical protein CsSME_00051593 [Camellia sinensis var. sinensis]
MEILMEVKSALKKQHGKVSSSLDSKEDDSISGTISCDEECIRDKTEQEQGQDSATEEFEKNDAQFSDSAKLEEIGKSLSMKREEGKIRALSGRVFNFQG